MYFLLCQMVQWTTSSFLLCSHHPFVFLWQCSRTQYAKCTDFKQWTASGCLCGNKWRSALCRSVSPNSCSRCTFRRTWVGKRIWKIRHIRCVDLNFFFLSWRLRTQAVEPYWLNRRQVFYFGWLAVPRNKAQSKSKNKKLRFKISPGNHGG